MRATFNVTYDIVTPESAEEGDVEERGFIDKDMTLRDAIDKVMETRTSHVDCRHCIEANESHAPRWITVYNGMEYETGANESRSLHIPDHVTDSSRKRIAKLMGVQI